MSGTLERVYPIAPRVRFASVRRSVHHIDTRCGSKNRYLVSSNWDQVSCSRCLSKRFVYGVVDEWTLPDGISTAWEACRCGECCHCRKRTP